MSKTDVITRKDMKEPDKFQQAATQAASWLATRKRHVVVAGGVVVGLLVIVAVLAAVERSRTEKAGAAAAEMLAAAGGETSGVAIPGAPGPVFRSEDERGRAVIAAADAILKDHPRGGAAELAALARGDALLRLRDWDGARASYERFLQDAARSDSLRFGALEGIAIAAEGKGDVDAAGKAYERMAREAPTFADRADLERARLLARAGRAADARGILGSFTERHKDSLLAGEASSELTRLGGK